MAAAGVEVVCVDRLVSISKLVAARRSILTGILWCPQLYALDWKQFRVWPLLAVHLPQSLLKHVPKSAGCDCRPSARRLAPRPFLKQLQLNMFLSTMLLGRFVISSSVMLAITTVGVGLHAVRVI